MADLILCFSDSARKGPCALCGAATVQDHGPQVGLAPEMAPVCRDCCRQHVPALWALAELCRVAECVGRVSHHTRLRVPLALLMELTRAAGVYFDLLQPGRKAG